MGRQWLAIGELQRGTKQSQRLGWLCVQTSKGGQSHGEPLIQGGCQLPHECMYGVASFKENWFQGKNYSNRYAQLYVSALFLGICILGLVFSHNGLRHPLVTSCISRWESWNECGNKEISHFIWFILHLCLHFMIKHPPKKTKKALSKAMSALWKYKSAIPNYSRYMPTGWCCAYTLYID